MGVNTEIEGNPKVYEYADMYLVCHSCGHKVKVFEKVRGGLQINLFATDKHTLVLECEECGNKVELMYEETEAPAKETKTDGTNEEIQGETSENSKSESEEEESEVEDVEPVEEEPQNEQVPEENKTEK